jgi:hypothetical protein
MVSECGPGSKMEVIDKILKNIFVLGFLHLDMYQITRAKLDFTDGWHWLGVVPRMNAMILLNLITSPE